MVYDLSEEALNILGIDEGMLEQLIADASDLLVDEDAFSLA